MPKEESVKGSRSNIIYSIKKLIVIKNIVIFLNCSRIYKEISDEKKILNIIYSGCY